MIIFVLSAQLLWISTRDQHPSDDVIAKAIEVVQNHNLQPKYLMTANQENCENNQNATQLHDAEAINNLY